MKGSDSEGTEPLGELSDIFETAFEDKEIVNTERKGYKQFFKDGKIFTQIE
jgi:hypothetical protein